MSLDIAAVLDGEVDGLTKAIPWEARLPVSALGQQGWSLLRGDLPLPAAILLKSAIDHNVDWMSRFTAMNSIRLCPHGKTSMSPQLFDLQLRAGAWGITAATVSHLHVYRRFGVRRILMANQLVDPQGIAFVLSELDHDPDFDFYCLVDSVAGVELLRRHIADRGCTRPLQVLVEMGAAGGRTGARSVDAALEVAMAVKAASPALSLRGVEGFEGALESAQAGETLGRIDRLFEDMRVLAFACDQLGMFEGDEIILTAGGSQYFDLPLKLAGLEGLSRPSAFVLRSGCYVTHDSSWFRDYAKAVADRMPQIGALGDGLRPAIEVWAYIQSLPEPGLALATMGKRDCSFDVHLPTPLKWYRPGTKAPLPLIGHRVVRLNDQHCYLDVPDGSPLQVGDMIAFGIAHPCTTFDRWSLIMMVDDAYYIVGGVRTFF